MKIRASILVLVVGLLGLVACGGDDGGEDATSATEDGCVEGEERTTDSGLKITDVVCGDGAEVEVGDVAIAHYTGSLEDGTEFDSSVGGEPYPFEVGAGAVIEGWDEGFPGMKVGGRRILVIPPELAYGSQGYASIPGGATLTFEVELVDVQADG